MPTLQDQLEELALREPVTTPTTGLWERGRRYGRRRRAGAVLVGGGAAAVVLAVVAVGWLRVPGAADLPATGGTLELTLPDAFHEPSRWLPTTDDPPGPLVAVIPTQDASFWGEEEPGVVGVSAATGEYAFLDLPGLPGSPTGPDDSTAPALSADGRLVAYWYVGQTRGEPVRRGPVLAGVAVYDTITGDVVRRPVPTEHGVNAAELTWSGDVLWMTWMAWDTVRPRSATGSGAVAWTPTTGAEVVHPEVSDLDGLTAGGDGSLVAGGRRLGLRDAEDPDAPVMSWRFSRPTTGTAYLSPDGTRVAALAGGTATSDTGRRGRLLVGEVGAPGTTIRLRETAGQGWNGLAGWRDDGHVVASDLARVAAEDPEPSTLLHSVDIITGDVEDLVVQRTAADGPLVLAQDALAAPTYDAPDPARPLDPRLEAALLAVALVTGIAGVLLWRRRVRP
ncbi:hypothetical protein [Nocardioides sp. AX2bis]|uniref:hypothetical protein n=1 Tax=Nocardioides sp. AX2bis TaxID=2653157 RepID=UPI0012F3ACC2|nr:hypothetical protein [Nocardioides sp. AX2bis]VXB46777.1 conserved hypothetical protein [Nocardioides sp. AX2bis]